MTHNYGLIIALLSPVSYLRPDAPTLKTLTHRALLTRLLFILTGANEHLRVFWTSYRFSNMQTKTNEGKVTQIKRFETEVGGNWW